MSWIVATVLYRPILATGFHAPLEIALPIIVVVLIVKVVWSKGRGRPVLGGKIMVRCSKGHVFTTIWSPLGSFTSIRLGSTRYQRCPVGNHWAIVKPVSDSDLTDEERRSAEQGDSPPGRAGRIGSTT
jgi:hypothetical protein